MLKLQSAFPRSSAAAVVYASSAARGLRSSAAVFLLALRLEDVRSAASVALVALAEAVEMLAGIRGQGAELGIAVAPERQE